MKLPAVLKATFASVPFLVVAISPVLTSCRRFWLSSTKRLEVVNVDSEKSRLSDVSAGTAG